MSLSLGPFQQTRFLGASISAFNANVGWNEQQGTLSVRVVEDPSNGDSFDPPIIGYPVYFDFMGFTYGGLLQSWEQDNSIQGKPIYNLTVVDPREILEGTQLVLDGYNGQVMGVPNLLNPYGYLESIAYGYADVNEGGMPWYKIQQALSQMIGGGISLAAGYGTQLSFMGANFCVDLSDLPVVPTYYRIGGGNITLLEAITQVCQDAGCDFFVRLVYSNTLGNVIQIKTVSRVDQPVLGQIADFVTNTDGVKAKTLGEELRNEVTTAFVVGGQVCQLYLQQGSGFGNGFEEFNTIWPFWGYDSNGNAVIGTKGFDNDDHQFNIDSRAVNLPGVGDTYSATVGEMRAAIAGEDSWRSYLSLKKPAQAAQLGITGPFALGPAGCRKLLQGVQPNPQDFFNQDKKFVKNASNRNIDPQATEQSIHSLFEFINSYASEYYGRKFMVRIPFVNVKQESETFNILLSQEPTDGGWAGEDAEPLGLPSFYEDLFQTQDGRFESFVRFDSPKASGYDLSQLSPEDALVFDNVLFLKCQVDPTVAFLDQTFYDSPRAIITLPGPVSLSGDANSKPWFEGLFTALQTQMQKLGVLAAGQSLTEDQKKNVAKTASQGAGGLPYFGMSPPAVLPAFAAVPLKSNVLTYGPWYNIGPAGKVRFERDETLVPWNYGGFDVMNLVGNAKVSDAVTYMQIGEMGRLDLPGAPSVQLGDELVSGGPNVTQIDVTVDDNGVATTYHLRTYTPRPYGFSKTNADRFTRLGRAAQQFRRGIRKLLRSPPPPGSPFYRAREKGLFANNASRMFQGRSPHDVLVGSVVASTGNYKESLVSDATFIEGIQNVQAQDDSLYKNVAFMSMDGLFRPYSVDTNYQGLMSHFETPTGNFPTINDLNPWGTGGKVITDISFATHGNAYPDNGEDSLSTKNDSFDIKTVRGIGFKTPMVLVGYGFDIAGKPTPSGDDGKFLDNYRSRPDKWKVGPLDVRWDDSRKVWGINAQAKVGVVILLSGIFPNSARPRYVVRAANTLDSGGGIVIDSLVQTPPLQSAADSVVFNIQEGAGEAHGLAVGSPVLIQEQYGVKFLNEHVRSLIRRENY